MDESENPLKIMALKWYGGRLTPNRERKLERLWRQWLKAACKPSQGELFS
jgi:hypothetical protein